MPFFLPVKMYFLYINTRLHFLSLSFACAKLSAAVGLFPYLEFEVRSDVNALLAPLPKLDTLLLFFLVANFLFLLDCDLKLLKKKINLDHLLDSKLKTNAILIVLVVSYKFWK